MRRLAPWLAVLAALFIALLLWSMVRAAGRDLSGLETAIPSRTALMRQREREARARGTTLRIEHRTVPYAGIAPLLRSAVLVAEDDAFFSHDGLDWNEIKASARANLEKRRVVRGGSTITQQLAKNLYLSGERSLTRKLEELVLAMRIERTLSKRRIFELYLNLIEWGDGVFGAEAAARHHFGVPSSALTPRQAVLLAAVIINPRRYSVLQPSARIERRARMIASRLHRRGVLNDTQYRDAIGAPPLPPMPAEPDSEGPLIGPLAMPPESTASPLPMDTASTRR